MHESEKFYKKLNLKVQKLIILGQRPKSMTGVAYFPLGSTLTIL